MGIQNWSQDIILVDLMEEPNTSDELKEVTEMVRDRGDCNVVIDFSSIDIVTSSSLSALLRSAKTPGRLRTTPDILQRCPRHETCFCVIRHRRNL